MSLHTLLYRRGAVYYYRQRVPNDLIPCVGKRELRYSLGTADPQLAVKRLRTLLGVITEQLELIRDGKATTLSIEFSADYQTIRAMPHAAAAHSKSSTLKLDDLYNLWLEKKELDKNLASVSTQNEWKLTIRQFKEVNGDLALSAITKEHIRRYKKALSQLPRVRKEPYIQMPLLKIVALVEKGELDASDRIAPTTIRKRITALSSLFNYAVTEDYIVQNPAKGQLPAKQSHNLATQRQGIQRKN